MTVDRNKTSNKNINATAKKLLSLKKGLNPKIWNEENKMHLEVRIRLLRTALNFYRTFEEPIKILDVVMTGSNAAYNWTDMSDIDLHLIANFTKKSCPSLTDNFFQIKRMLWNKTHDISIRGHVVEIYVENETDPAQSNGAYSIIRGEWIKKPEKTIPSMNNAAVLAKAHNLADDIEAFIASKPDDAAIAAMLGKLYRMRARGLGADAGEFSTENIAFKILRNIGLVDSLRELRTKVTDKSLSLEEME